MTHIRDELQFNDCHKNSMKCAKWNVWQIVYRAKRKLEFAFYMLYKGFPLESIRFDVNS